MDGARVGRLAKAHEDVELLKRGVKIAIGVPAVEKPKMVSRRGVAAVEAYRPQKRDPCEVAIVPRHLDDAEPSPAEGAGLGLEIRVVGDLGEPACRARIVARIQGDFGVEKRDVWRVRVKRHGL